MNLLLVTITPEVVEECLQIASMVEKALPPVYRKGYIGQRWDIIRELDELMWDKDEDPPPYKFQPTNQQVSLWEEVVLRWYPCIKSGKDKKILWMRSCGMGWTKIAKKLGLTRQTVATRHKKALQEMATKVQNLYPKIS